MNILSLPLRASVMAAASLLAVGSADAALYTFSQGGYDEGATISGSFEVVDFDASGHISGGTLTGDLSEIITFTVSFSGNSIVPAFTHTTSELTILNFTLGGTFLGDEITPAQEAIGTNWFGDTGYDYASGIGTGGFGGSVTDKATGGISYSDDLVKVSAVPVPAAVWLLGSALAGLVGLMRRRMT